MDEWTRILIVDDDPVIRELPSLAFDAAGHQADMTSTAAEARERLRSTGSSRLCEEKYGFKGSTLIVLVETPERLALPATLF